MMRRFGWFALAAWLGLSFSVCADNGGLRDFGVAYYPEAWPEERWETDLTMMRELGVNLIRIGEFNWSNFEPTEGVFDFKPYLRLLDLCEKHGIKVMMCTPTAATPKWMQADWPETEKTRDDGTKPACGIRQSACATNARFRFFARRITEKMAEAFKDHPAVTTWQLDNELNIYGATRECNCKSCEAAYRQDLKRRYGTLDNLNREFNGSFWSGKFTKWEDVRLPIDKMRTGWKRDYVRFLGEQFLAYTLEQAEILRRANPKWRITSNNPSCSNIMRHDTLFRNLGYAAADTYCASAKPEALVIPAWEWASFRGLTGRQRPFMVGETGPFCFDTDSDWSFDLVKPWFWLMVGHGAESIMYFRWRMSVSGEETHGAILPWNGKRTFVYDMIKKQMDEYRALPESIATLPLDRSDVAIVHDAASHIYTLSCAVSFKCADVTMDTEANLLAALERRGVKTDIVQLADDMDLDAYKVAFFPLCLSLSPEMQAKIRAYVAKGGAAVAVNRMNFNSPLGGYYYPETCPVGMTDLFGVEISERRTISYGNVELAELTTAEALLRHAHGCFKDKPLLTRRDAGKGAAYYCTRTLDLDTAREVAATVMAREGVAMREELPPGVARMTRGKYAIVVNYNAEPKTVAAEEGDVLLGEPEIRDGRMTVKPFGVVVCRERPVPERLGRDIRDRIYAWGYVLDKTPTACPFVFGKTDVSLERAAAMLGAGKAMYMNSMFNRDYIIKYFPKWDRECFANCIDTKLSERHWELMKDVPEVWCAVQHGDRLGSAKRIAELSLRHKNIRGINLDDFNDGNPANAMTPDELMALRKAVRAINPELMVAIVTYADDSRDFDLTPFRDAIDLVSRWKWKVDSAHWDDYKARIEKVRTQVGPRVRIVQGLYLHDFGAGMESRIPLPIDYFKRTVRKACECVTDGTLDGIILPQVGWYSSPAHQEHVRWLRAYLAP